MLAFLDAFDPTGRWALVDASCKNTTFLDRAGADFDYRLWFLPSGYLHVNRVGNLLSGQKRAGKDDVSGLRYAHCEIDCYKGESLDWGNPGAVRQQQQLCMELIGAIHSKFGLHPAFVVWSGGGVHLYYKLREEILLTDLRFAPKLGAAEFEEMPPEWRECHKLLRMARAQSIAYVETVNKALAACANGLAASMSAGLHADPVHNVDRILRLPGCENVPSEDKKALGRVPALVEVMYQALPEQPGYKGFSAQDFAPLLQAYGFDVDAEKEHAAQAAVTPPKQGSDYAGPATGSLAVERARYVLNHIPCDRNAPYTLGGVALSANDYWTWIHMGMALKDELAEAGFAVWAEWSARWESGFDEGFGLKKWHSFSKSGTTFSTTAGIAKCFGYDLEKDPWLAKIRELENEGLADGAFAGVQGAEEVLGRNAGKAMAAAGAGPSRQSAPADGWPDPEPLIPANAKRYPYPLEALPARIREACEEVTAFTQTPREMAPMSALSILSVAAQGHVNVQRDERLEGPVSIYNLGVADSGERKSTQDKIFSKPVHDYQRRMVAQYAQELRSNSEALHQMNTQMEIEASMPRVRENPLTAFDDGFIKLLAQLSVENYQRTRSRLQEDCGVPVKTLDAAVKLKQRSKADGAEVHLKPIILRGDDTTENLAFALKHEWPSAAVIESEAGIMFGGHAMRGEQLMKELAFKNKLWDGADYAAGRRTSESFVLHNARFTYGLQIQEGVLKAFSEKNGELTRGIGFWSRFLFAWPESTQGTRFIKEGRETQWTKLPVFHGRVQAILDKPLAFDESDCLVFETLRFSPAAQTAWTRAYNEAEHNLRMGGDYVAIRDIASKAAENIARTAALFHVFDHDLQPGGQAQAVRYSDSEISREHVNNAAKIVKWHLNEALRFFGMYTLPEAHADAVRFENWLKMEHKANNGKVPLKKRDWQRKGPVRNVKKDLRLDEALKVLEESHHLRQDGVTIWFNPKIWE